MNHCKKSWLFFSGIRRVFGVFALVGRLERDRTGGLWATGEPTDAGTFRVSLLNDSKEVG